MTTSKDQAKLPEGRGLWCTAELTRLGISAEGRRRLLAAGVLYRVRIGLFAQSESLDRLLPSERATALLNAHVHLSRMNGEVAYAYSHTSAARLHGLSFWRDSDLIHVTSPSNPCTRRLGSGVRVHVMPLPAEQVSDLDGVRATTLERTVIDCARIMPLEDALVLADQALARGADTATMKKLLGKMSGYRGVRNARLVLELADKRSESVAESRSRLLFHLENIPAPELQWKVMTPSGIRRLDFAWPEKMLAVEFDGEMKYFGEKPTEQALYEERLRERQLMEQGWRFIHLTWKDLDRPGEVRRRITKALSG